jgi:hypothetical protein
LLDFLTHLLFVFNLSLYHLQYFLFDLHEDPYEMNNLYDSHDEDHAFAKQHLYDLLPAYLSKGRTKKGITWSRKAEIVWHSTDSYVVPWADADELPNPESTPYPILCPEVPTEIVEGDPTTRPKKKPA